MSIARPTGEAGFLARYEGLRDRLPGDPVARAHAAEAFRRLGLPGRRNEAWKYTNLRPIAETAFHEPLTAVTNAERLEGIPRLASARIVFTDGRYRPDLSDVPGTISFGSFADHPRFGGLANPEDDVLAALNGMLAEDGAVITVPEDADGGVIQLVNLATGAPTLATAFHPRHCIRLASGARLVLIETALGEGTYLHNPVIEVELAERAMLQHVRLQTEAAAAFHLCTIYAQVASGATYDSFVLNLGARLARTETHARLAGAEGATHLNGAQLLGGSQHADITSVVRHDAPSCASRQVVKNVLAGRSRAVFQGRIEVARTAQKTDGYQMSQTLLLSPDAEIDTKPELEIFADDVKCSHGATVGALDPEQLFYLRSRGVPEAAARSILIRAFLTEALETVSNETARTVLTQAADTWWEKQAA